MKHIGFSLTYVSQSCQTGVSSAGHLSSMTITVLKKGVKKDLLKGMCKIQILFLGVYHILSQVGDLLYPRTPTC